MGRPTIGEDKKRSEKITFRVTYSEQLQLNKGAILCNFCTGDFIRQKLFKGKFPEPKTAKVDLRVYLELKKIGVNINQLTRLANAGRLPVGIITNLKNLMAQQDEIIRILIDDSQSKNR